MINVSTKGLKKQELSGLSVSFYSQKQHFPSKGERIVVKCEVWGPKGQCWGVGRAILNPLDTFNVGVGCRKALSNALINSYFSPEQRREIFDAINWETLN